MSTIKNGQVSLYCHLNKIVKGPGTRAENMLEMFVVQHTSI